MRTAQSGPPGTGEPAPAPRRRGRRGWGSSLFFAALAVVLVAIAYVYTREQEQPVATAPPPNNAGHYELVNVYDALKAAGLKVDYLRGPGATVRGTGLDQPGQGLTVEGQPLYVFIFGTPEERSAVAASVDPATFTVRRPSGTPATTQPLHLFGGANVLAALAAGSADLVSRVQGVIEHLPALPGTPPAA